MKIISEFPLNRAGYVNEKCTTFGFLRHMHPLCSYNIS